MCLAFCFLVSFPSHSSQLTSKTVKPLNKDRRSEIELKDMRVFALQTEEESILKLTISIGSKMMDHLMHKCNNTESSRVTPSVSGCLGKECPST